MRSLQVQHGSESQELEQTRVKFFKQFDAVFDEGISQFKSSENATNEMKLDVPGGSTIRLDRLDDNTRRIWTQTPMYPPGKEYIYSNILYEVKVGQKPKKIVTDWPISADGILGRGTTRTSEVSFREASGAVSQASRLLEKLKNK